jgi:hypothetical protein
MRSIAKIAIATLMAALSGAALAESATTVVQVDPPGSPAVTTGSVNVEPTFDQRMQECMAIWEPRTHMTKQQWRRSCKTTLQSLTD